MVGLVNREREVARLSELWERSGPALALIHGRRRVGKTFFLQHFLQGRRSVYFLAADSTSQENLGELLDQVRTVFPERQDATPDNYPTWRPALRLLCDLAAGQAMALVLDEFGYLAKAEPSLPSVIQALWDREAQATQLKLILCGSELGVMSTLDDYGQPLHGRFDWNRRYEPLDYYDTARFILALAEEASALPYSARDMLVAYGLYGGAGRYLAAIDARMRLSQNVSAHLLDPDGIFHNEGESLLRQEREIRDVAAYNAILAAVAGGATEWGEILNQSHVDRSSFPHYMASLQQLGWVLAESPFEESGKRGLYRLADNLLKSWYRYVFRHRSSLRIWEPAEAWSRLVEPDLPNYMGSLVFEGVCHEHVKRFSSRYSLPPIMDAGRWWNRRQGIEIDLVARLHDGSYLFGECKWASSPVEIHELSRLRWKVDAISKPKWKLVPRYALFCAGEFDPLLREVAAREGVLLIGGRELFPDLDLPLD